MAKKWDWTTIGLIVLAQIGLGICYWGIFSNKSASEIETATNAKQSIDDKMPANPVSPRHTVTKRVNNQEILQAHFEKSAPANFPPVNNNTLPPEKTAPLRISGTGDAAGLPKSKDAGEAVKTLPLPGFPAPNLPTDISIAAGKENSKPPLPNIPPAVVPKKTVKLPKLPKVLPDKKEPEKKTPMPPPVDLLIRPPPAGPKSENEIPIPPPPSVPDKNPSPAKTHANPPAPNNIAKASEHHLNTHICTPNTLTYAAISKRYYSTEKYAFALANFNSEMTGILKPRPLKVLDRIVIPHVKLLQTRYAADILDGLEKSPPVSKKPPGPSPWKLSVEFTKGRTRLTARTGKGIELVIRCERLKVKRPNGNIEATGQVAIEGKDLNGGCDRLTILWEEEQMRLAGNAFVRSRRSGEEIEMKADDLRLRLNHK